MEYREKSILVTGGTGTAGSAIIRFLLRNGAKKITIVSRNELNQMLLKRELSESFGEAAINKIKFVLCDIRNNEVFKYLFIDCDIVIHTAALKYIELCEENIREAFEINVNGTQNVIENSINGNVEKAIMLSTDKACSPCSVYGATKLIGERAFIDANKYGSTKFSVIRCGNIVGSGGSVVPYFQRLVESGEDILPVTHPEMCRFWVEAEDVVKAVDRALSGMIGGEVFIPEMPSFRIVDLAKAISGRDEYRVIGLRKGERIEEHILNADRTVYRGNGTFVELSDVEARYGDAYKVGYSSVDASEYTSARNTEWLTVEEIKRRLGLSRR